MAQYTAFTVKASNIISKLILDVSLCLAVPDPVEDSELTPMKALIDMGRERTVISPKLMMSLLSANKEFNADLDKVTLDIYLPNRIRIAGVPMDMATLEKGIDCCLGMDILMLGDFSLSNFNGKTQFSFRVPCQGGLDYVELHNSEHGTQTTTPAKKSVVVTGRDAICPCGSGKKHKNCCAKLH